MFDILERLNNKSESRGRRFLTAIILFLTLSAQTPGLSWAAGGQNFRNTDWLAVAQERHPKGGP
jgi:hypothetical protein